jgi:hypothetical protein
VAGGRVAFAGGCWQNGWTCAGGRHLHVAQGPETRGLR